MAVKFTAGLVKTPLIDPRTGMMTQEWIRYFIGREQSGASAGIPGTDAAILAALLSDPSTCCDSQSASDAEVLAALQSTSGDADAVQGGSTLIDIGAIPKVTGPGTLGESAMTDDGTVLITATDRNFKVTGARPTFEATATGGTQPVRYGALNLPGAAYLTVNMWFDGTNWNLDDTSATGQVLRLMGTTLTYYTAPAGANPATLTEIWRVSATGTMFIQGVQVVGPQLPVVTAPSGGGTSISAPVGGTTVDTQARAAINSLISAVSSGGNTVDPNARTAIVSLISKLSLAAGGTGITA